MNIIYLSKTNVDTTLEVLHNELRRRNKIKNKRKQYVWRTDKGDSINIEELNSVHLCNIIDKMERFKKTIKTVWEDV